jgi:hypothetical protein
MGCLDYLITINALKFNKNWVDMPTTCQSIRMGTWSHRQDLKPKSSLEAKVILIYFFIKILFKDILRIFLQRKNLNAK